MSTCKHLHVNVQSRVGRIIDQTELPLAKHVKPLCFSVDLQAHCAECKEPLEFGGVMLIHPGGKNVSVMASIPEPMKEI